MNSVRICCLQLLYLILEKCPSIWWMPWNTLYLWFLLIPLNKGLLSFLRMIIPFRLYIKPCSLQLLYEAPVVHNSMYIVVGNNNQLEDEILVGNMISATTRRLPRSEAHFSYHLLTSIYWQQRAVRLCLCCRRLSHGLMVVAKKTLRSVSFDKLVKSFWSAGCFDFPALFS